MKKKLLSHKSFHLKVQCANLNETPLQKKNMQQVDAMNVIFGHYCKSRGS